MQILFDEIMDQFGRAEMSCGVELNEEVILLLGHLVKCLLSNDINACIYQKIVLFLHLLIFNFELLD